MWHTEIIKLWRWTTNDLEKQWKTGSRLNILPLESRVGLNAGSMSCAAVTLRLCYSTCEMGVLVAAPERLALKMPHTQTGTRWLHFFPNREHFLTPLLLFPAVDTVTFTKTPGGLGSAWLSCLYLNSGKRTLSWRRSGTTVYTISVRPRIKALESGLGLNPHWAPYLLAVWLLASYLALWASAFSSINGVNHTSHHPPTSQTCCEDYWSNK